MPYRIIVILGPQANEEAEKALKAHFPGEELSLVPVPASERWTRLRDLQLHNPDAVLIMRRKYELFADQLKLFPHLVLHEGVLRRIINEGGELTGFPPQPVSAVGLDTQRQVIDEPFGPGTHQYGT